MRAAAFLVLGALAFAPAALFCVGCGGTSGDVPAANINGGEQPSTPVVAGPSDLPATGGYQAPRPEPNPRVVIHTNHGDITVQLDRENAGITVDNFLEYVDSKFYNDTLVHYVGKGQMVLAGAFDGQGNQKATRPPILNEAHNGRSNRKGTIAMSRDPAQPISATSQFFFNLTDNTDLDHKDPDSPQGYGYCVFGEVVGGMEVLEKIALVPVEDQPDRPKMPVEPVVIRAIERAR